MQVHELRSVLTRTPIMLQAHPALLALLPPEVEVFPDAQSLVARLDDPCPWQPAPMLTLDINPQYRSRLPLIVSTVDPYTEALNDVLPSRYDTLAQYTLTQRQIADVVVDSSHNCEIVILLLVDGLAYRDARDWPAQVMEPMSVVPCLAEGPTITKLCFPAVIGAPPIAVKLFDVGYTARVGFSYWSRDDNALTDQLFATIRDVRLRSKQRTLIQSRVYWNCGVGS